jgi:endonuclease/exonuclease/phosphatase (EEP) superfamily protein YafD
MRDEMAPSTVGSRPESRAGTRTKTAVVLLWLRWLLVLVAWAAILLGLAFTIPTVLGKTPHRVYAALQLVAPWLGLAAGLCLLVAAVYRRPFLALASGFCVLANVVPVWGAIDHVHVAPMSDAAISIYVANMRVANPTPEAQVQQALASGADVLVLAELSSEYVRLFDASGVGTSYPYQALLPHDDPNGVGIYSRRPLLDSEALDFGAMSVPAADVAFGDGTLRIIGVHTYAPKIRTGIDQWSGELEALDAYTHSPGLGPTVMAGDYNATRWHPAMRRIMNGPFVDAHEEVGKGLTSSWPADRGPTSRLLQPIAPFARLDHALVHDVGVAGVNDGYQAAGSDHLPFMVTLVPEE